MPEQSGAAYEVVERRQVVFGKHTMSEKRLASIDGESILRAIKKFQQDSLAGKYYAPFKVNSRNWTHIPNETKVWFEQLGLFLTDSIQLTAHGEHAQAVACFGLLYELVAAMEKGLEIVFADELGSWMIPGGEKKAIAAYFKSLAIVAGPEDYAAVAVPLIKRDGRQSFADQVYTSAMRAASQAQQAYLTVELERQHVPIGPDKSKRRAKRQGNK